MFLKYLLERYEQQAEMEVHNAPYSADDLIHELGTDGKHVSTLDYHKTVLAKGLAKKGKVSFLDNGMVVPGKVKKPKPIEVKQSEQTSLF